MINFRDFHPAFLFFFDVYDIIIIKYSIFNDSYIIYRKRFFKNLIKSKKFQELIGLFRYIFYKNNNVNLDR